MRRPVLAPGLRVLRYSRDQLQIGLSPERRLRIADTEPVRRTLGHLVRGETVPDGPETRAVLEDLAPVLIDSGALVTPGVDVGDAAALALHDPSGYLDRLNARRHALVRVIGSLGVDPRPLFASAGLRVDEDASTDETPSAALVLSIGEVDRAELDPLLRGNLTHLVVRLVEGSVVLGPLVVPGSTACVRCIDAHTAIDDPHWPALAARHASGGSDRHDGVAEPVDSALATLAVAWAVRDLVSHVEGSRPATWSTTVRLAPALASITETQWLRHPACGCVWLSDDAVSRTMEA
jgi:bacteriocin biosynthesis cyclodehydratase domain-containing protein